jgi:hypothetical protein
VPVRPPPCGHGWDISARDGMCYPTGSLAPRDQAARQYQYRRYRGDRYYDDDYYRRLDICNMGRTPWHNKAGPIV